MESLAVGIIAGAVGMGYIVYGRRQVKFSAVIAGVLLCAYPYFVDSVGWQLVVGAVLVAAPFVIDF